MLSVSGLSHSFHTQFEDVPVLKNITFNIQEGELVALQGPSGSGKSTLFYLLGCLLSPQKGKIEFNGKDVSKFDDIELAQFRNRNIGFIFQQFHLNPKLTVRENILLPCMYPLESPTLSLEVDRYYDQYTKILGIEHLSQRYPNQLSGGQQQRVAIARALIQDPQMILADEPTGNLDTQNTKVTLDLLKKLKSLGKTIIIITHDKEVAKQCDRVISIRDGELFDVEQTPVPEFTKVEALEKKDSFSILNCILKSIPMAFTNLKQNKGRTLLTMIGITIGITSMVSLLTFGRFVREQIVSSFEVLGANKVRLFGWRNWQMPTKEKPPLTFSSFSWEKDLVKLDKIFDFVSQVSPVLYGWDAKADFGGVTFHQDASVLGVNYNFTAISNLEVRKGRALVPLDIERRHSVCVIGSEVAKGLFQRVEPIGQIMYLESAQARYPCKVVGVLKQLDLGDSGFKPNNAIFTPFTYFQSVHYEYASDISQVVFKIKSGVDVERASKAITHFFEGKYGKSGSFHVTSDTMLVAQMKKFLTLFALLLGGIAVITLSVGGIGIHNMMLASVNERIREIGLRKALGATDLAVKIQLIVESTLICVLAGIVGVIIGFAVYHAMIFGASQAIQKIKFQWTLDPLALFISFVAMVMVGILSGLGPSKKAQRLDVIQALRAD